MIISAKLISYCLVAGAAYLALVSLVLEYAGRRLGLLRRVPGELLEESSAGWFVLGYVMEFLFFVAIPTTGYSFFYVVLPFYSIRAGMAAALFAFTLGATPVVMGLSIRFKLPMPYLLYSLLSYLLKIGGSMIIISYLYAL